MLKLRFVDLMSIFRNVRFFLDSVVRFAPVGMTELVKFGMV